MGVTMDLVCKRLKIEFSVNKQGEYEADAKVLPGLAPIGIGGNKEEAVISLLAKCISDPHDDGIAVRILKNALNNKP